VCNDESDIYFNSFDYLVFDMSLFFLYVIRYLIMFVINDLLNFVQNWHETCNLIVDPERNHVFLQTMKRRLVL
jgi:hypothetical protein